LLICVGSGRRRSCISYFQAVAARWRLGEVGLSKRAVDLVANGPMACVRGGRARYTYADRAALLRARLCLAALSMTRLASWMAASLE
jgi:hypothetical protein